MQITFPTWRCSICSWSCYGPAAWSWVLLLTVLTGNGNVACITNEFRWGAARRPLCSFWQVTKASCHCSFQPTPSCSHSSPHFFGTNCFFHILPRGSRGGPYWKTTASDRPHFSWGLKTQLEVPNPSPTAAMRIAFRRGKIYEHHCHASNKCQKVRQKCGH